MRVEIEEAAILLNKGQVVAVPTETVYGLAASLACPETIKQIFSLKGRPSNNPLIIHLHHPDEIEPYVYTFPKGFKALSEALWPGPITLVMQVNETKVPSIVRAGLSTAAFRIPQHPLAIKLLEMTGPLVMPSANLSGKPSATRCTHVEQDFGSEFPVLDGGTCHMGLESTILIYLEERWSIIRQGALTPSAFEKILGYIPVVKGSENQQIPLCPGQLFRHYAPKAKLILSNECSTLEEKTILGFTDRIYSTTCRIVPLGALTNPSEIAKNLYRSLRFLDEELMKEVFVDVDFPNEGLLETVRERLTKAAAQ
ncbi:MAG: L-threonylcarbamoyladenylate synthase [Parachlamydiaceae bacterium]